MQNPPLPEAPIPRRHKRPTVHRQRTPRVHPNQQRRLLRQTLPAADAKPKIAIAQQVPHRLLDRHHPLVRPADDTIYPPAQIAGRHAASTRRTPSTVGALGRSPAGSRSCGPSSRPARSQSCGPRGLTKRAGARVAVSFDACRHRTSPPLKRRVRRQRRNDKYRPTKIQRPPRQCVKCSKHNFLLTATRLSTRRQIVYTTPMKHAKRRAESTHPYGPVKQIREKPFT